jgi:hypothetical protein
MDIKKPVLLLRSIFSAVNGNGWNYAQLAHERDLQRFDAWMQKTADQLPHKLTKKGFSSFSRKVVSPVQMTSTNWYSYPPLKAILEKDREAQLNASTQFAQKAVRSGVLPKEAARFGFFHMMKDPELPAEYEKLRSGPGYKALQQRCDEAGLQLKLMDSLYRGVDNFDSTHRFSIELHVDPKKWPLGTSIRGVGQALLDQKKGRPPGATKPGMSAQP